MTARFPRTARVRASAEFDLVFKEGRRVASPLLALHVRPDASPARLGLAVSRKVDPHAVGRNRIKRVVRDAFRALRTRLPDGAYVVVARPPARSSDNRVVRDAFLGLLQRAGALPLPGAAGTIAPAIAATLPSFPAPDSSGGPSTPAR